MRSETVMSEAIRKSRIYFLLYCISAAVLLGVSTFVRWGTIRRFLDFQSAVELGSWRFHNILVYAGAAVLTAIIMFIFLHKAAVSKVEGVPYRDRKREYGEYIVILIIYAFLLQIVLLALSLAVPVFAFGGGFIVIPYHLVRIGIYHLSIWLITIFAIILLNPGKSGPKSTDTRKPSRWNK